MTPDLQKYYESRMDMFFSQGWRDLMQDIDGIIEARNTLYSVNNEQELHFAKGELSILNWIKGLQEVSWATFEQLKAEE